MITFDVDDFKYDIETIFCFVLRLDLDRALVIAEFGSNRDQEIINPVTANMHGIISKPKPAHG